MYCMICMYNVIPLLNCKYYARSTLSETGGAAISHVTRQASDVLPFQTYIYTYTHAQSHTYTQRCTHTPAHTCTKGENFWGGEIFTKSFKRVFSHLFPINHSELNLYNINGVANICDCIFLAKRISSTKFMKIYPAKITVYTVLY